MQDRQPNTNAAGVAQARRLVGRTWWNQNEDTSEDGCLVSGEAAFEPERNALAAMGCPDTGTIRFISFEPEDRDQAVVVAMVEETTAQWLDDQQMTCETEATSVQAATDPIGRIAKWLTEARDAGYTARETAEMLAEAGLAVAEWATTEDGDLGREIVAGDVSGPMADRLDAMATRTR